ncbi:SET domain-containing protein [Candidatus Pacearchaeota archaeon]|nr:SET domain-containing protein [Candidatus Pacearchaeota archaeon]
MGDVVIKKSKIGQFKTIGIGDGIFANRNFKKGEIVIKYNLKHLTPGEFENLPESEKEFTHSHFGKIYLYSIPERYVNHSSNPNTIQDIKKRCDIALRNIKKGEEITTDAAKDDTL